MNNKREEDCIIQQQKTSIKHSSNNKNISNSIFAGQTE